MSLGTKNKKETQKWDSYVIFFHGLGRVILTF